MLIRLMKILILNFIYIYILRSLDFIDDKTNYTVVTISLNSNEQTSEYFFIILKFRQHAVCLTIMSRLMTDVACL